MTRPFLKSTQIFLVFLSSLDQLQTTARLSLVPEYLLAVACIYIKIFDTGPSYYKTNCMGQLTARQAILPASPRREHPHHGNDGPGACKVRLSDAQR